MAKSLSVAQRNQNFFTIIRLFCDYFEEACNDVTKREKVESLHDQSQMLEYFEYKILRQLSSHFCSFKLLIESDLIHEANVIKRSIFEGLVALSMCKNNSCPVKVAQDWVLYGIYIDIYRSRGVYINNLIEGCYEKTLDRYIQDFGDDFINSVKERFDFDKNGKQHWYKHHYDNLKEALRSILGNDLGVSLYDFYYSHDSKIAHWTPAIVTTEEGFPSVSDIFVITKSIQKHYPNLSSNFMKIAKIWEKGT